MQNNPYNKISLLLHFIFIVNEQHNNQNVTNLYVSVLQDHLQKGLFICTFKIK